MTAETAQTPPETAKDDQASLKMIEEAEAHLDLTRIGSEAEFLMEHLTSRYEEILAPVIAAGASSPVLLQRSLKALVRQLARTQADVFVLKSAVLGRDRLVMTQDWDYRDPVRTQLAAFGEDLRQIAPVAFGTYSIYPDEAMIGYGWYQTEKGTASAWRWSGPDHNSGIFLPNITGGECEVTLEFSMLSRDVIPEGGMVSVNREAVEYQLEWTGDLVALATFPVKVSEASAKEKTTNFLVGFKLAQTLSPAKLLGKSDTRKLGICLRKITYRFD